MKHTISLFLFILAAGMLRAEVAFDDWFYNTTLRLDYAFCGDSLRQEVFLDEVLRMPGTWHGRRTNLDQFPTRGMAQLTLRDAETDVILYRHSFATLFQEWVGTEEATLVSKSFQNVVLVPEPRHPAVVEIVLYDFRDSIVARSTHPLNPSDILQRPVPPSTAPVRTLMQSGSSADCIDIAIVAEGYQACEMDKFYDDARRSCDEIFRYEPFASNRKHFNVRAVGCPSVDSGVSVPHDGQWRTTALSSHFDTFYSDRYLTTLQVKTLHNLLAGIPAEHIIILANTNTYGGGGIYNFYNLTSVGHKFFLPVLVHEFGHSFAALADEYFYDDQYTQYFYPDREPWVANLTTQVDFGSKWQDLVGTTDSQCGTVGLFEGGGYQSHGVWRPCDDCRMRTNLSPNFCPVCRRELQRIIDFYVRP